MLGGPVPLNSSFGRRGMVAMSFENLDISPWFWETVERGGRDPDRMREVLDSLSGEELQRFADEFEWAITQMRGRRFAQVHGDSEDIAEDVAAWVVSQGRDYYARVYDDPALFPNLDHLSLSESFVGLAEQVYEERFGEEMPFIE
jgi:hypothetical protein